MKSLYIALIAIIPFLIALSPGEVAPQFTAKNQNGKEVRLSDFKGKYVLLYFYPKDDTPGCTKEACTIRDEFSEFKKVNAVVLGVSRQDEKSHQKFKEKYRLPYDLLVDSDGTISQLMGVEKYPVVGLTKRQSVLIGPDGHVLQFYSDVNPNDHAKKVLADIKKAIRP